MWWRKGRGGGGWVTFTLWYLCCVDRNMVLTLWTAVSMSHPYHCSAPGTGRSLSGVWYSLYHISHLPVAHETYTTLSSCVSVTVTTCILNRHHIGWHGYWGSRMSVAYKDHSRKCFCWIKGISNLCYSLLMIPNWFLLTESINKKLYCLVRPLEINVEESAECRKHWLGEYLEIYIVKWK